MHITKGDNGIEKAWEDIRVGANVLEHMIERKPTQVGFGFIVQIWTSTKLELEADLGESNFYYVCASTKIFRATLTLNSEFF